MAINNKFLQINGATDIIQDTSKVTSGFFTGNLGVLSGSNFTTKSLSTTQKNYYSNIQYSSEDQFSVAFAHISGSGSTHQDTIGEAQAIYKQFANMLMPPERAKYGFEIQGTGSVASEYVYILVAERARMKDRLNKKNWHLQLSGSNLTAADLDPDHAGSGSAGHMLDLTDDSEDNSPVATPVGPRYNIVSGSSGTTTGSDVVRGWFYPNVGIMVFDGDKMSGSLPGSDGYIDSGSNIDSGVGVGFAPELNNDGTAENALKFFKAISMGKFIIRNEEDQTSKAYFCRTPAAEFNFSNNPTFASSSGEFTHSTFVGDPQTFISTIGLYNHNMATGQFEPIAVGRLSSAVQKNYGTEATIKVKLTF